MPLEPAGTPVAWLSPLEEAWGIALGRQPGVGPLTADDSSSSQDAFEAEVLVALLRPPCLVAFSGGRDSSTVLATAVSVARRHGLPLPIPITHVFPEVEDSEESEWQERVVRHLGPTEWVRLTWTDELDTIGPFAQRSITQLGVASPSNLHFLLPFLDAARGGSLLTGVGGDEIFSLVGRTVAARVLYRTHRLRPREIPGFLANLAPRTMRTQRIRRGLELSYPWIRTAPMAHIAGALADWISSTPIRFDEAATHWWYPSRVLQIASEYSSLLAASVDVALVQPFSAAHYIAALAGEYGKAGPGGRHRALTGLCGDLLPPEVLSRTSKAGFDGAFNTSISRTFAAAWDGTGLDETIVDAVALQAEWLAASPDPHSLVLLQRLWLQHQKVVATPGRRPTAGLAAS